MSKHIEWDNEEVIEPLLRIIYEKAKEDCSQKEIAEAIDVGYSTFRRQLAKNEHVRAAYKKGLALSVKENLPIVEGALLRGITGYFVEEEEWIETPTGKKDKDGKPIFQVEQKKGKKRWIPGVASSQYFYLVNKGNFVSINKKVEEVNFDQNKTEFDVVLRLHQTKVEKKEG